LPVKANLASHSNTIVIIGNAMFGVYHKADCEWVNKIPPGRRFKFVSVEEAEDKNYNPCHVCFGENEALTSKAFYQTQTPTSIVKASVEDQLSKQEQTSLDHASSQQTGNSVVMFIGNRLLGIYHKPDCEWAKKIPNGKRINFYSEKEVERANYRHCHVCS
jgi:methylphosphotriester-DNA--protein-cysteine methyltransferase